MAIYLLRSNDQVTVSGLVDSNVIFMCWPSSIRLWPFYNVIWQRNTNWVRWLDACYALNCTLQSVQCTLHSAPFGNAFWHTFLCVQILSIKCWSGCHSQIDAEENIVWLTSVVSQQQTFGVLVVCQSAFEPRALSHIYYHYSW